MGCDLGDLDRLRKTECAKLVEDRGGREISEVAVKDYAGVLKVE